MKTIGHKWIRRETTHSFALIKQTTCNGLTSDEAYALFDYHENSGMFPEGITKESFDEIMDYFDIHRDEEDNDLDPAGGHGLYSHI